MHPQLQLQLQARIRIVQSPANRWVKALRAASRTPPTLAQTYAGTAAEPPLIALEGPHLLAEALRSGLVPSAVFLREGSEAAALDALRQTLAAFSERGVPDCGGGPASRDLLPAPSTNQGHPERSEGPAFDPGTQLLALPPALFDSLLETSAPQPIAALLPAPRTAELAHANPLILVLAGIQDPGNLGTLLRSAEAFGATAALLLSGAATPWSAKALRASAGSALRLPLVPARDAAHASALLRGIRSYAAVPSGGALPSSLPLHRPTALWIGNEGAGLSADEVAACDARVTLRTPGPVESLNAAVAGSLLLYEAARRRAE